MTILSKQQLYGTLLQNAYRDNDQLLKHIERFISEATSKRLSSFFYALNERTNVHLGRVDYILKMLGEKDRERSQGTVQIIANEAFAMISQASRHTRDLTLILVARKIEHYRIASYDTLCLFAKELGFENQAMLLQASLMDVWASKQALRELAEQPVDLPARAA